MRIHSNPLDHTCSGSDMLKQIMNTHLNPRYWSNCPMTVQGISKKKKFGGKSFHLNDLVLQSIIIALLCTRCPDNEHVVTIWLTELQEQKRIFLMAALVVPMKEILAHTYLCIRSFQNHLCMDGFFCNKEQSAVLNFILNTAQAA